ncbi:glycosyl hydrolase [Dysgonomonas sp. 520]|uniref:glycosyl hydrolase n=1 Tax=Dysgonomonas sp. 520 TaxID=2302931 RepID=UPI0013D01B00|nr:glycosyl hydrolase [Dysgonomonas sp. 520]NDW08567.1 hypothetical protein [Dysgonomonas sp. 520]
MIRKILFLSLFVSLFFNGYISADDNVTNSSPWGVAAHLRLSPHKERRTVLLNYAKDAGIKWMRDDLQFANICAVAGEFDFAAYDLQFQDFDKAGVQMIGILQGFDSQVTKKRPELVPLHKHPEEWRKFVKATVERYHDRIKYWEIWNEQDGGFWASGPNRAKEYVSLLKIAYTEIKAIDPEATVIVGGLCGWNGEYLKGMYLAGAKGYFDAIAVHPYHYGVDMNAKVIRERNNFYDVLTENDQQDIPIWITECGGSSYSTELTEKTPDFILKSIQYALTKIGNTDSENLKIGVAVSPRINPEEVETMREWLPGIELQIVTYEELLKLDPKDCPVLIGAEGSGIDQLMLEPLRNYVMRGGLMLAMNLGGSSIPLYTTHYEDANGEWKTKVALAQNMEYFRMKYEASWTIPGGVIPESTTTVKTSDDALAGGVPSVTSVYVNRFVNAGNMKEGDTYYPIVEAYKNNQRLPADGIGLYTYGDWKGGIIYSAIKVQTGYSAERQGNLLQRVYLSYLSLGVKKIFWYDLHNDGGLKGETEHNFGLIDWNGNPKQSFFAYRRMTIALGENPVFEQRLDFGDPNVWGLVFRKSETKERILAIWSTDALSNVKINISDAETQSVDLIDNVVQFITLSETGGVAGIDNSDNSIASIYNSGNAIRIKSDERITATLYTLTGILKETKDIEGEGCFNNLASGIYILRLEGQLQNSAQKIIIK